MPEFRKDPISDRWVIISTERGKRPSDYTGFTQDNSNVVSPFIPGNEAMTPDEVYALRGNGSLPNSPGWRVRVVPNKYPALDSGKSQPLNEHCEEPFYKSYVGTGMHEVVIETTEPNKHLENLSIPEIRDIFMAYQSRLNTLKKDTRWTHALIFKNHGMQAGATIRHAHSQIIALPFLPPAAARELHHGQQYYLQTKRCISCNLLVEELRQQTRVIYENSDFVTLAPYAPRFSYETWILPKQHSAQFETSDPDILTSLATVLRDAILRLNHQLGQLSFNMLLYTAPLKTDASGYFHWRVEILPRLAQLAGFEQGSGVYINDTSPEAAALSMRKIAVPFISQ